MNDYNYTNLRLSLKVVSLQICYRSSVTIVILINYTGVKLTLFLRKFSHRRNTSLIKKLKYFHVLHTQFAMTDKRKFIKNPYAGKKKQSLEKTNKIVPKQVEEEEGC